MAERAPSPVSTTSGVSGTLLDLSRDRASEQTRRLAEARAREHVGAAGWAQTSALESIIRAGQAQFAATAALRDVVQLTTDQLRSLPLASVAAQGSDQDLALKQIVEQGQQQVKSAEALSALIHAALRDVVNTPVQEVSLRQLENIGERVRGQLEALHTMLDSARAQAHTLSQLQALDMVSREHAERVTRLRAEAAGSAVERLGQQGAAIVEAIADLDVVGTRQAEALRGIGTAAVQAVQVTGASRAEQLAALDAVAQTARQQADRIKDRDP